MSWNRSDSCEAGERCEVKRRALILRLMLMVAIVGIFAPSRAAQMPCGKLYADRVQSNRYVLVGFLDMPQGRRTLLQEEISLRLSDFARTLASDDGSPRKLLAFHACDAMPGLATLSPADFETLTDRNVIGAVWPAPESPGNINVSILALSYLKAKQFPDLGDALINMSVPVAVPSASAASDPAQQWSSILSVPKGMHFGVLALGLGLAQLQDKRYLSARTSFCQSRVILERYSASEADSNVKSVLAGMILLAKSGAESALREATTSKLAETAQVRAACAAVSP